MWELPPECIPNLDELVTEDGAPVGKDSAKGNTCYARGLAWFRFKVAGLLLMLAVAGAGVSWWSASPGGPPSEVQAAPAPVFTEHRFVPVNPNWDVQENLLRPDTAEPYESYIVIAPRDRGPRFTGYIKEVRYTQKGAKNKVLKILRYYPSGKPFEEIDNDGDQQYSRRFRPDGSVACYLHWRAGKWLNGYSVSPDGKTSHRLRNGRGEIVLYGQGGKNRLHRWYHDGLPFLEKFEVDGKRARVRLHTESDMFEVLGNREMLLLYSRKEIWTRSPGQPVQVQMLNDSFKVPGPRDRCTTERSKWYPFRRAEFLQRYTRVLKAAGYDWKKLDIEFIRTGWPVRE
jgi:hypothetical protein